MHLVGAELEVTDAQRDAPCDVDGLRKLAGPTTGLVECTLGTLADESEIGLVERTFEVFDVAEQVFDCPALFLDHREATLEGRNSLVDRQESVSAGRLFGESTALALRRLEVALERAVVDGLECGAGVASGAEQADTFDQRVVAEAADVERHDIVPLTDGTSECLPGRAQLAALGAATRDAVVGEVVGEVVELVEASALTLRFQFLDVRQFSRRGSPAESPPGPRCETADPGQRGGPERNRAEEGHRGEAANRQGSRYPGRGLAQRSAAHGLPHGVRPEGFGRGFGQALAARATAVTSNSHGQDRTSPMVGLAACRSPRPACVESSKCGKKACIDQSTIAVSHMNCQGASHMSPRIALALAALVLTPVAGAQLLPLGSDFDVSRMSGRHETPVAAAAADGSVRLVWTEPLIGLHDTRFDKHGARRLPLFQALSQSTGDPLLVADEQFPRIYGTGNLRERHSPALTAPELDGSFWLVWTEKTKWVSIAPLHYHEQTLEEDIYAARFGVLGRPIGQPLQIDGGGALFQGEAAAVARPGGGLVAVWEHGDSSGTLAEGDGIRSRVVDGRGAILGSEVVVDEGLLVGRAPALAVSAVDNTALVAWEATEALEERLGIWVRLLDTTSGQPLGAMRRIDAIPGHDQKRPAIAALPDGDYLVVWQDALDEYLTGRPGALRTATSARRLDAKGEPIGPVFTISSGAAEQNTSPSVVSLGDGRALAAWITWTPQGRAIDVVGSVVDANGAGPEIDLSTWRLAPQASPALAAADGTVLVSWTGFNEAGKQVVVGRRFAIE